MVGLVLVTSCSQDENEVHDQSKDVLILKFQDEGSEESSNKSVEKNEFFNVEATVISHDPIKLYSPELTEVEAVNQENQQVTYGYILKEDTKESLSLNKRENFETGYFWDGDSCFVHGTMIYGDNGQNLFVPTSMFSSVGFEPVCASYPEAFAIIK